MTVPDGLAARLLHAVPNDPTPDLRFEWERLIRGIVLPAEIKATALALATYGNADGSSIRPGYARLAEELCVTTRTVERHMAQLRKLGLVACITPAVSPGRGGGVGRASVWQLDIPEDIGQRARAIDRAWPSDEDRAFASYWGLTPAGRDWVNDPTPAVLQTRRASVDNTRTAGPAVPIQPVPAQESPDTGDRMTRHGCRPTIHVPRINPSGVHADDQSSRPVATRPVDKRSSRTHQTPGADPLDAIIAELHALTARTIDRPWAQRVLDHITGGRPVANPAAYCRAAIRSDPNPRLRFLPVSA